MAVLGLNSMEVVEAFLARMRAGMRPECGPGKCPKEIAMLAELPRNPSGKVLKTVLRKTYTQGDTEGAAHESRR